MAILSWSGGVEARPLVLGAAQVKENCSWLSFIAVPSCPILRRASIGKFCRVSRGVRPPQGRVGGRCEWELRSREAGSAPTQARKACRKAKPSQPAPAKGRLSVGQHVFVIGQRLPILTRFVEGLMRLYYSVDPGGRMAIALGAWLARCVFDVYPMVNNFRAFWLPYLLRLVINRLGTKSYSPDNHRVA